MLKPFGNHLCPRCRTRLVHEYDLAGDWSFQETEDQRLICPDCGLSRPVIYAVERPVRAQRTNPRRLQEAG